MHAVERMQKVSQYFATLLRRREDFAEWLWHDKHIYRRYPLTELFQELGGALDGCESFGPCLILFREFKQRHFLRIGGRDLSGLADLSETTSQLSDLACVTLQVGLSKLLQRPDWWLSEDLCDFWRESAGNVNLIVMGLGKLGGHELNYVSDIDLLFLRSPKDESVPEHHEGRVLVDRLLQTLSRLMAENVDGDRVFQVDLRLRPQGKDGPLVPLLAAASEYYLNCGRPWERQVLLKARPVAGDRSLGTSFLHEVRPFVFRRFLDFQALDELRAMRDRILVEAVRPGAGWKQFDVKLGIGGIREIEFLVQSLQLIYGGRHPELEEPNTLRCLDRLRELDLLPAEVTTELKESYAFLRRVEHWVQLDQNRQTQKLPQSTEAQLRLAQALGCEQYEEEFIKKLEACCMAVHKRFMELFHSETAGRSPVAMETSPEDQEWGIPPLEAYPEELLSRVQTKAELFPIPLKGALSSVLKEFSRTAGQGVRERILVRLDRYLSQASKRPGLIKLFHHAESWAKDFLLGIVRSEMLADLLAHHPSLVEGLASVSGRCPDHDTWQETGARLLDRVESYEEGLEWIRRLKNERLLQLALGDLRGEFDHSALERQISALADFVMVHTYGYVRKHLGLSPDLPLTVLGMGRLGSQEMSYLSDLDLVFVYSPAGDEQDDAIPPEVIRFIQRFMRMLSTPLQEGPGYSVDARLRPTGNYGPLIVTAKSWLAYYTSDADLWEVQALLRVRSIAGDQDLGKWIEEMAAEICYRKREPSSVWGRLCHLRGRMERERADEKGDSFDIKLGRGGLVDLEFLAQGHQLIDGWSSPTLRSRSLQSVLPAVLDGIQGETPHAKSVWKAMKELCALGHRLRLQTNFATSRVSPEQFEGLKDLGLWPPAYEGSSLESWEDLVRMRRRVRSVLGVFCPELA